MEFSQLTVGREDALQERDKALESVRTVTLELNQLKQMSTKLLQSVGVAEQKDDVTFSHVFSHVKSRWSRRSRMRKMRSSFDK